ncbi:9868_t:CDS:10 [Ambispora gerdemannii]|uniref:9868_t:CDS:1 n=1 Tax=Ambispora gerdemannii TaxID=144530 RepID=A0A9N9GZH0_9GLOM|nr:9868_t:CDS:10 [Ambispora gerdemannii]
MSNFFEAPAESWTYSAIAENYGVSDDISRIFLRIKKDLEERAEKNDPDGAHADRILKVHWQVRKAITLSWATACRPLRLRTAAEAAEGHKYCPKLVANMKKCLSIDQIKHKATIAAFTDGAESMSIARQAILTDLGMDNNPFLKREASADGLEPNSTNKRLCTPSPFLRSSSPSAEILLSDSDDEPNSKFSLPSDCPVIINDVVGLQLGSLPRKEFRWVVMDVDISDKWHLFKETSLKLAKEEGLLVESHPQQHCPLMVEVFGFKLLEAMYKDVVRRLTEQETELDAEVLIKLTRIVKRLQREEFVRYGGFRIANTCVTNTISIERVPRVTLKSSVGEIELCTTYIDPVLAPVFADPDRGVQEEMNNLYSLCADLIRVAVFNKDAIDFYNKNCVLGFQVVGRHITFYLTTLLYDGLYVMVEVGHIDVPMSLEQLPAFIASLDTLLVVSNAFWTNCATTRPAAEMEPNKRDTKL